MPIDLDLTVLRTLIAAEHLGAMSRAADKVGRSQSAVTQQIQKLEQRIGQPLFRKQGRGRVLTEAGEILLTYAQRMIELNDEAVAVLGGIKVNGVVRFGFSADFAHTWLPVVLEQFKRTYPNIRIEAMVDRNAALAERLEKGQLDLTVLLSGKVNVEAQILATLPMAWIGRPGDTFKPGEPVQLALLEAPCFFRTAAINALDEAGIPWEIAFTTPNVSGLWAAVNAGLGITVRTPVSAPAGSGAIALSEGLAPLPPVHVFLSSAGRTLTPAAQRLKEVLLQTRHSLSSTNS
ncbi:LysR substrate-binding domain-containing protein [Pseudomonas tolaasii]|uniref:LysR substrate-binding domain-containing protein n=1 Tax=Pseudomonas tolaasii TaxID=29442 RepID=UPI001C5272FB|nr:LysR substrate-binding domain-containing protein [Pseudomonas tolaasii]QXQ16167.1 LysR family transcriptional regulator [Pseudomonas tolaasii]